MRKYILFLLFACLHLAARGQTIEDVDLSWLPQRTQAAGLQYWFDDDKGSLSTSQQVSGTHLLDVSSLLTGLHTIHYQIIDNTGKVAVPYSALFLKTAQYELETASGLQYWFDDDAQSLKKTSLQNGVSTIDVSSALEGLHTLHFQILDSHGMPSAISSAIFMKMGKSMGDGSLRAERMLYWYDDEEQLSEAELDGGLKMLDASHLTEGLHTLHYQVLCNNGAFTTSRSAFFFRVSYDTSSTKAHALRYWYDDQTTVLTAPIGGGTQMLDVADLMAGLHVLHVQIEDESGGLGVPTSAMFLKMDAMAELAAAKSQRYWFDEDVSQMRECAVTNGVQELDVKGLSIGFHTLHYQLVDGAGNVTVPYSDFFMKMAECDLVEGKNAIIRYQYWLNDDSQLTTIDVSKPTNPFQLISLIPMESKPIRSSCFHFEAKEGEPMIYAKNDIHFRFYDAFKAFGDESAQFIDYKVARKVTDITPLQTSQTFERPEENEIKWFCFEAAPGDTIAFRSNQATSLQVFAPSGNEILSAMGDKSVQYTGAHTWEEGTYYVAVHDATGSRSTITLDYMHMDKYDVVDQDVRVVGDGGCSTITFQGNGFRDLYEVVLYSKQGEEIHSIDIGHESDASTTVTFDFTDVALGNYDALFRFTEEDKTFAGCITVEEAKEIELENSVTYNGIFLVGREADFTLKVVNNGNMTAYSVPIQIEVRSGNSVDDIKVKCDRFPTSDNCSFPYDSIDPIIKDVLTEALPKLGTLSDFFVLRDEDGQLYYRAEYSMTLPPNSETVITTSVGSRQTTEVYYIVPSNWAVLSTTPINGARRMARAKGIDAICCNKERIKCVANIANLIGGFTAYGCATSIGNEIVEQTLEGMCPDEGQVKQSLNKRVKSIAGSIMNALIDCVTGHFDDLAKGLRKALKGIEEQIGNITKQISKLSQERDEAYQSFRYLRAKATEAFNNHDAEAYQIWMDQADEAFRKGQSLDNEIAGLGRQKEELLTQQASKNKELFDCKEGLSDAIKGIRDCLVDMVTESSCYKAFKENKTNCPPPYPGGGNSSPVNSLDPNDIYGYIAESGSRYIGEEIVAVPYRIEFENDTTFATASAHTVIVKDTLDATLFDLSSYRPMSIKIGEKNVQLKGDKQFVTTVDMRPAINAIAQVDGSYDEQKGIATWQFTSLDPMTMEPTNDVMQGFLPINYDGISGIGEVAFDIALRQPLADGTEIPNRASIIFDSNEPILTPTWTNIIDAIVPKGSVIEVTQHGDSASIVCNGTDERSGIWKYEVYTQPGVNAPWLKVGECFADSAMICYEVFEGLDYGFCALAVDSAGNVEQKEFVRELSLNPVCVLGDVNGDNEITIDDVIGIVNILLQIDTTGLNSTAADINQDGVISIKDVVMLIKIIEDAQVQNEQPRQSESIFHNSELEAINIMLHKLSIDSLSIPVRG